MFLPSGTLADSVFTPDFELFFGMSKSVRGADGRVWVEGIASDESEDLDGEIVKAAAFPQCIHYLGRFGKFNFDHNQGIIGDVEEASLISPKEALERFGQVVKGKAVAIRGWFAPLSSAPDDKDLQELHKLHKAGAKLGFSMQGRYKERTKVTLPNGREVIIGVPSFVPQVAITPQPKNSNAICFAKSLANIVTEDGLVDVHVGNHWPIIVCPDLPCIGEGDLFKSLEATGALAVAGTTGGDALKVQDLVGPVVTGAQHATKKGAQRSKHPYKDYCHDAESSAESNAEGGVEELDEEDLKRHQLLTTAKMRKSVRDMIEAVELLV